MQTLGSTAIAARRSESVRPPPTETRYKTLADTYFGMKRNTRNSPVEGDKDILKNHYKFHKGTTYSIGNEKDHQAGYSLAQESFVPKHRMGKSEIQPGRRN